MKQFLAFIATGILALIALGSLGGMIGFAIGAGIVYWSYKSFVRAQSFFGKLAWGDCWFNRSINCSFTFSCINWYCSLGSFILRIP